MSDVLVDQRIALRSLRVDKLAVRCVAPEPRGHATANVFAFVLQPAVFGCARRCCEFLTPSHDSTVPCKRSVRECCVMGDMPWCS